MRIQLTLTGNRRGAAVRSGEFRGVLRVGTHNFPCAIFPTEPLVPGGAAVHCSVVFADGAAALPHFPAGGIFELWENGRAGYGMVLAVASAA